MVPLQAVPWLAVEPSSHLGGPRKHTEFLLDDLEDLLVIELGGYALHRSQGLASITLCSISRQSPVMSRRRRRPVAAGDGHATVGRR